jgi:hypothetical protein
VDSLAPRWIVEAHLGEIFEEETPRASSEKIAELTGAPPTTLPAAEDVSLREKNTLEKDWLSRNGAQDRAFKSGPRERTSDTRASTTDPDATPMAWFKGGRSLGYQTHYVVLTAARRGNRRGLGVTVVVTVVRVRMVAPLSSWSSVYAMLIC